ncbi:MAG TPA: 6-phosphogluconolactonase [Anaerolineaceae bacterium]
MIELGLPEIEVVPDSSSLAERAADEFVRLAGEALQIGSRFTVALAGGSTPQRMYTRLAGAQVDWRGVHVFWGDERCVPPGHADSNYRMADEALLSHVPIPRGNLHRIPGELPVEEAAQDYEDELRRFFSNKTPRFDLVLLGLGEDGHTASLFPGSSAILEKEQWVAAVRHSVPPPPLVDRVTLTLPVLNAAAQVLFLVSGADKAERLAQVLDGPSQPDVLPAQAVKPVNGAVRWLVDQAAAAKLPPQQHQTRA